jgi:hypothetical protein
MHGAGGERRERPFGRGTDCHADQPGPAPERRIPRVPRLVAGRSSPRAVTCGIRGLVAGPRPGDLAGVVVPGEPPRVMALASIRSATRRLAMFAMNTSAPPPKNTSVTNPQGQRHRHREREQHEYRSPDDQAAAAAVPPVAGHIHPGLSTHAAHHVPARQHMTSSRHTFRAGQPAPPPPAPVSRGGCAAGGLRVRAGFAWRRSCAVLAGSRSHGTRASRRRRSTARSARSARAGSWIGAARRWCG